jgi:hypothetical protein
LRSTTKIREEPKFTYDLVVQIKEKFVALHGYDWTPPAFVVTYDDANRLAAVNGIVVTRDDDGLTYAYDAQPERGGGEAQLDHARRSPQGEKAGRRRPNQRLRRTGSNTLAAAGPLGLTRYTAVTD